MVNFPHVYLHPSLLTGCIYRWDNCRGFESSPLSAAGAVGGGGEAWVPPAPGSFPSPILPFSFLSLLTRPSKG